MQMKSTTRFSGISRNCFLKVDRLKFDQLFSANLNTEMHLTDYAPFPMHIIRSSSDFVMHQNELVDYKFN